MFPLTATCSTYPGEAAFYCALHDGEFALSARSAFIMIPILSMPHFVCLQMLLDREFPLLEQVLTFFNT